MISRSIISDRILAIVVYIVMCTSLATYAQNVTLSSGNFFDPKVWSEGLPKKDQTLIIMPGHILSLNRNGESESIVISSGAELILANKILTIRGNLTCLGKLNAGAGTVIFSGGKNQAISLLTEQTFNSITITNNSNVLISNARINLTGTLNIVSGSLTTNNKLTLISTALKTANIGTLGAAASINGEITVQQFIYSNIRLWRYISSPVQNATVSDWQNEIPITGTFENPSTGTGLVAKSPSLYYYDETLAGASSIGYVKYPNVVNSANAPLQPGRGYSIFVRDNVGRPLVLDVQGVPNTGDQNIPVTYTVSGGITEDGWNLVGNPFPSSISWDSIDIASRTGISNAIYYSDNNNGSLVMRSYVNGLGTPAGTTGIIHSSQAFWVKAIASNPQLIIREDDKVVHNTSFYRIASKTPNDIIRIKLDDTKGKADETVIRIHENATTGFDINLDAVKYPQSTLSLSSKGSDANQYCINSIPYMLDTIYEVKLTIGNFAAGNYSMTFFDYQNMDTSIHINLVDKYLGTLTDVRNNPVYSFAINSDTSSNKNRFLLHFKQNAKQTDGNLVTDTHKDVGVGMVEVFPNPASGGDIIVQSNFKIASISLLDISGKEIKSTAGIVGNAYRFSVDELPKGLLLVVIHTQSNEKFIEKLIIK